MKPEDIERMNRFLETTSYDKEPARATADLEAAHDPEEDEPKVYAAGVLYFCDDGRVLLMRRTGKDHAGEWALPGGGIEEGEDAATTAAREFEEETGHPCGDLTPVTSTHSHEGVHFTAFVAEGPHFSPKMDEEHDVYMWASLNNLPQPMHPGMQPILDELTLQSADLEN